MANKPATNNQIAFIKNICKVLNNKEQLIIPTNILEDFNVASFFINKYKKSYYDVLQSEILGKIDFREFLTNVLGGYTIDKEKASVNSPKFNLYENGTKRDSIVLRFVKDEKNPNLEYFVFWIPDGSSSKVMPPQLNLKLDKLSEQRKVPEKSGGNLIDFISNRALNYSVNDIIGMLYDISQNPNNITNYGLKLRGDTKYEKPSAYKPGDTEKLNEWRASFKTKNNDFLTLISSSDENFSFRGLDSQELLKSSSSLLIGAYGKKEDYTFLNLTREETKKEFSGIFEIICPTHIIDPSKGMFQSGYQAIPVIDSNIFFNQVRKEAQTYNGAYPSDSMIENIKNKVYKMSKMDIPSDLNTKKHFGVMSQFFKKKIGYINESKLMGKGTIRGITILFKPEKKSENRNLVILENPVLDGMSAIKLGFYDKNNTTLVGTLGNPTQEFFNNLEKVLQVYNGIFTNIVIATDRDKAGDEFFKKISDKTQQIIANNNYKNLEIFRGLPSEGYKDYNEELMQVLYGGKKNYNLSTTPTNLNNLKV